MNKRGIALILCYMIIAFLAILGIAFTSRSISESNINRRYSASTHAFWIAEAGLSQGYYNIINSHSPPSGDINFGGGTYNITQIDHLYGKEIVSTGRYDNCQRAVKGYILHIPHPFENTLSVGGNLSLSGALARVEVFDKTRISGTYSQSGARGVFSDKQEGVNPDYTTIKISDYNNNGTSDEFGDFVLFGQAAVGSYPSSETVYIQTNDTVNIWPNRYLVGKKIIYVEGSSPGAGDVNIWFDPTWRANQDLTIISTGTVTYIEPLQNPTNSRLSTVSWDDYVEGSIFRSQHQSVIYAHDDAIFVDILDWGSTTGNVITNSDTSLLEILTYEKYYWSDRAANGDMPPGFRLLCGSQGQPKLVDWQEAP